MMSCQAVRGLFWPQGVFLAPRFVSFGWTQDGFSLSIFVMSCMCLFVCWNEYVSLQGKHYETWMLLFLALIVILATYQAKVNQLHSKT